MADGGASLFCTGLNARGAEVLTEVCSWLSPGCCLLRAWDSLDARWCWAYRSLRGTRWTLGIAGLRGRCFGSQSHDRPCCSHAEAFRMAVLGYKTFKDDHPSPQAKRLSSAGYVGAARPVVGLGPKAMTYKPSTTELPRCNNGNNDSTKNTLP